MAVDASGMAYKILFVVLTVQISLFLVNATGVFSDYTRIEYDFYDQEEIAGEMDQFDQSTTGYLGISGAIDVLQFIWNAFYAVLRMVVAVFTTIPNILVLFYVPPAIANVIGLGVDVLLFLSIVTIAMNRSG
jgi:hypothetical protein